MQDKRLRQAAILAVGTELTEGQIINGNAAWLSRTLSKAGFEVVYHLTVPDDRPRMHEALDFCAQSAGLLFVTGGLGPTSDDFTREVIADWAEAPLEFRQANWERVQEILTSRGARILDMQKKQAYFPKGATVLPNLVGTAEGFSLTRGDTRVWVMPGPPREIESVWLNGIAPQLETLVPKEERLKLWTWQCIGKGESEIADLAEKALSGSGLKIGYRLNAPYVELKVWCDADVEVTKTDWHPKLEEALAPWLITRNEEDLAAKLLPLVPAGCVIVDCASDGLLSERLNPFLRKRYDLTGQQLQIQTHYSRSITAPKEWAESYLKNSTGNVLMLAGFTDDGKWAAGFRVNDTSEVREWPPVVRSSWWTERGRKVASELALQYWVAELSGR